jgi:hypothetical protein
MNELDDRELETLLEREVGGHLAGVLDAHVGRAAEAFLAEVAAAERGGAGDRAGTYRLWWWALAAGAAAACVAVAWLIHAVSGVAAPQQVAPGPVEQRQPAVQSPGGLREVLHSVSWRTVDEGTLVLDDVPLHRVRRRVLETEEWYDAASKMHVEVTTPREEVIFVGMRQQ